MKPLGNFIVITGSMFAGKSEELIRQLKRAGYAKKKVQAFKHAWDDRFTAEAVTSHDGAQYTAVPVASVKTLVSLLQKDTEIIGIEEVQFFDDRIIDFCVNLADKGKTIIVAGLDQDFRREPFGVMPKLIALADEVIKLRAICMRCGRNASHTQRLINGKPARWDDPIVLIGASESYEARCRACHEVIGKPQKPSNTKRANKPKTNNSINNQLPL